MSSNDKDIISVLAPVGVMVIIREIIHYGKKTRVVEVRSLTPDEMEELIMTRYISHMEDFYIMLSVFNYTYDRYGIDKVKETYRKYAEIAAREECKGQPGDYEVCVETSVNTVMTQVDEILKGMDIAKMRKMYEDLLLRLAKYIQPPPSMLLIGPPGIGKSETVRRVALKLASRYGLQFVDFKGTEKEVEMIDSTPWTYFVYVDFRLTSAEPSDLMGIPDITGKKVTRYKPFGWAYVLSIAPGVLFLDEFTNIGNKDVLSASYQIILDRRSGFTKFNNAVLIVSAGNPPEYARGVAHKLPPPLADRFEIYNTIAPTPEQWISYMNRTYGNEWIKMIGRIVKIMRKKFAPEPKAPAIIEPDEKVPTPRSWTRVSVELYRMYKSLGYDPENMFKKICLEITSRYGSCSSVRKTITSEEDKHLRLIKNTCEILVANLGSVGELVVTLTSLRFTKPIEEIIMSKEEIKKQIEEAVNEVIKKMEEMGV